MTKKYILKLNEYISWPFKKYQKILSQVNDTPAYEIKDVQLVNGKYKLLIQINGSGKMAPYLPQEIAEDDLLVKKFSTKDIRLIHYLTFEELQKPKYTIVGNKFSDKNKTIFCIKERETGVVRDYKASELASDKDFLKQCSSEDACKIGYFYGSEEINVNNNYYVL